MNTNLCTARRTVKSAPCKTTGKEIIFHPTSHLEHRETCARLIVATDRDGNTHRTHEGPGEHYPLPVLSYYSVKFSYDHSKVCQRNP